MSAFAAPRALTVYITALVITIIGTIAVAYYWGAFREELHPDPTRGNYHALLAIVLGLVAWPTITGLLIVCRWLIWPNARTTLWNFQATVVGAIAVAFVAVAVGFVLYERFAFKPDSGWTDDYGDFTKDGAWLNPYFPSAFTRLEQTDKQDASSSRFREFGVEGNVVFRREGFLDNSAFGSSKGQVSTRKFDNEKDARKAIKQLIDAAKHEGYRAVNVERR